MKDVSSSRVNSAPKTYIPILKCKDGEYKAFPSLDASLRLLVRPLFEVLPVPDGDVDGHLAGVATKLTKYLVNWPLLYLDFGLVDPAARCASGAHPVRATFDLIRSAGIRAVPVTGVRRSAQYQTAVAHAASKDGRGICVRLKASDLVLPDLAARLDALLASTSCAATDVDLVLDFEVVAPGTGASVALTLQSVLGGFHRLSDWRTVTFAGTAFPQSLAAIPPATMHLIERAEWSAWNIVRASAVPRMPGFGDYGISHPQLSDVDPRFMTMSANIRYTANGDWLCVKGRGVKKHGYPQFHSLSADLVRRPEYAGRTFSDADEHIFKCARRLTGPGNPTTWRWVGNVHHITAVGRELATLP